MTGRRRCLYWDGHDYQLACPDDLCHGSDETLCGLYRGFDFDVDEDERDDDEWMEDPPPERAVADTRPL